MEKFIVKNKSEEGSCTYCGEPIYIGDYAVIDYEEVFCCNQCAKDYAVFHAEEYHVDIRTGGRIA